MTILMLSIFNWASTSATNTLHPCPWWPARLLDVICKENTNDKGLNKISVVHILADIAIWRTDGLGADGGIKRRQYPSASKAAEDKLEIADQLSC